MNLEHNFLYLGDPTFSSTLFSKSCFWFVGEKSLDCLVIRALLVRQLVSFSFFETTLTSGCKTHL